jgi:hypothetical protein
MFFVFFFWGNFMDFVFEWIVGMPYHGSRDPSWPIVTHRPLASTKGSFAPQNLSATQHGTAEDSQSESDPKWLLDVSEIWLWLADVVEKKVCPESNLTLFSEPKLWSSKMSARSSPGNLSWSQHPLCGWFRDHFLCLNHRLYVASLRWTFKSDLIRWSLKLQMVWKGVYLPTCIPVTRGYAAAMLPYRIIQCRAQPFPVGKKSHRCSPYIPHIIIICKYQYKLSNILTPDLAKLR